MTRRSREKVWLGAVEEQTLAKGFPLCRCTGGRGDVHVSFRRVQSGACDSDLTPLLVPAAPAPVDKGMPMSFLRHHSHILHLLMLPSGELGCTGQRCHHLDPSFSSCHAATVGKE